MKSSGTCYTDIKDEIIRKTMDDSVFPKPDSKDYVKGTSSAISMGFWFAAYNLYGLPEREDTLPLKDTKGKPYHLFATDEPMHVPFNPQPLYGSVPYITSLDETHSTGLAWVNSASTFVDVATIEDKSGRYTSFVSESGAMEFFMFASKTAGNSNRVKKVQEDLAIVTGYIPLPPLHTLGFHFCKWAPVSADTIIERNRNFTEGAFPIDVLWSDIEWA
jgi:mannosyl-oligosaccharide alpha-1,3-glucosidase